MNVLILTVSLHEEWGVEGGEVTIYDEDRTTGLRVAGAFPDDEGGRRSLARLASEALNGREAPEDEGGPAPVARALVECVPLGTVSIEGSALWEIEPGWSEEEILQGLRKKSGGLSP
jgi:hypothetical protein